jgi:hypothetical protein
MIGSKGAVGRLDVVLQIAYISHSHQATGGAGATSAGRTV